MTYTQLAIGAVQFFRRKGSLRHKQLGKIYMLLMLGTSLVTLSMPAQVGPQFLHHFGFIHVFSILGLIGVPTAYLAARRGYVRAHAFAMIALYIGGILIAGAFAFSPGRMLHGWLFG
jgi:uncharacterized membrane protein